MLKFWIKFWLNRSKCPVCFGKMYNFNEYGLSYSYCAKDLGHGAWYDEGTEVKFQE